MNLQQKSALPCICGVLFALGATGCTATGMVQTAQTVGKGGYEVSIDPGVTGAVVFPIPGPLFHAAFRYGITDRIDIGARVGTMHAEVQAKFLLTEPENENIAVSIVPAVGALVGLGEGTNGVHVPIPLLVGIKLGAHELTFGPRVQNTIYFSKTDAGESFSFYSLGAGLSLGFAAQATNTFRILPELSFAVPLVFGGSDFPGSSAPELENVYGVGFLFSTYSFNLGLQFGSPRKKFTAQPKK